MQASLAVPSEHKPTWHLKDSHAAVSVVGTAGPTNQGSSDKQQFTLDVLRLNDVRRRSRLTRRAWPSTVADINAFSQHEHDCRAKRD